MEEKYFTFHESSLRRWIRRGLNLSVLFRQKLRIPTRPLGPPDWVATPHSTEWAREPSFAAAYEAAVREVGDDYRIPWRINLLAWGSAQTANLVGDIVELGTGRGFSMTAITHYLDFRGSSSRNIWCFDVFLHHAESGLGDAVHATAYASGLGDITPTLRHWDSVKLVRGDVRHTLHEFAPEQISLLHVDLNDPDTESWAIRLLWPRIVQGGLVILDDYANFGMEKSRSIIFGLSRELGFEILTLPSGQGLVMKQSDRASGLESGLIA